MRLTPLLVALLSAALLAGCINPAGGATTPTQKAANKAATAKTVNLSGAVSAPAGVISTGGGNVISTGGGNVISTGGGNVISTGGGNYRHVLAVEEAPLANTPVYLADGNGNRVSGVAETKTDANGKFSFSKVPAGGNYMVVAKAMNASDKKEALLRSLVKVGNGNADTRIGASTTMVSALILDKLGGNLGGLDPALFDTIVKAVGEKLTADTLPDFSDPAEVLSAVTALSSGLTEIKGALDSLGALPGAKEKVDAAKDAIDKAQDQIASGVLPLPF